MSFRGSIGAPQAGTALHMSKPITVEHVQSFDVHVLHHMGALQETLVSYPWVGFRWPGLVRLTANKWRVDVEFRHGAMQRIPIVWTQCHFGGWRPWVKCLQCDRKVRKLYFAEVSLACRQCSNLLYACQRRGAKSRRYLKALKLRLRLNGIANLREPFPARPKGMHRKTYARLHGLGERLEREMRDSPRFLNRETDYAPLVPR